MKIKREWATPLVIGAFLLSAVTGVAMFFEVGTLIGKNAHQYLGFIFVLGGLAHVSTNWVAFKRYLKQTKGRIIIGVYALIVVASFIPVGPKIDGGGEKGLRSFIEASTQAPLKDLAVLLKRNPDQLVTQLKGAGYRVRDTSQSLSEITAKNGKSDPLMALNGITVLMKSAEK